MNPTEILITIILLTAVYSTGRLTLYILLSNIHLIRERRTVGPKYYRPKLSIIIPAHNEAAVIERTLRSVANANYPRSRLEVIVANDGSTDQTAKIVRSFAAKNRKLINIKLRTRPNRGKAEALNYATKKLATGQLIMCLDADSIIDKDCLVNSVKYFYRSNIVATASNVNVIENGTLLGLAQRFEYLMSHHMKRTNTQLGIEYIIGGVGSTFRRSILGSVNYYDSDTMTEDIDLTLKIIQTGNKQNRVVFAADAITYTEPVQTYGALIKQRFRWRYGRMQSFWKNRSLFFNPNKNYNRLLTFYLLPSTLVYEFVIITEPIIVIVFAAYAIVTGDISSLLTLMAVYGAIGSLCIWSSDSLDTRTKLRLSRYIPLVFILIYWIVIIEYITAAKSLAKLHAIPRIKNATKTTWVSPKRDARSLVPEIVR